MQLEGQRIKPFVKPRKVESLALSEADIFRSHRLSTPAGQIVTQLYYGTCDQESNDSQITAADGAEP